MVKVRVEVRVRVRVKVRVTIRVTPRSCGGAQASVWRCPRPDLSFRCLV